MFMLPFMVNKDVY